MTAWTQLHAGLFRVAKFELLIGLGSRPLLFSRAHCRVLTLSGDKVSIVYFELLINKV